MEATIPNTARITIGVPKETAEHERRVALIPDGVKKYTDAGHRVLVESGAGAAAFYPDEAYADAGATIVPDAATVLSQADLVLKVQKPNEFELRQLKRGGGLVAFMQPMVNTDLVEALQEIGTTSFSMDAIPRTTRAQYMDALSSMATVSGYKAVLLAADNLAKFMPLLTTAAGNIKPAKVLVIGAGVAGLQAIATARRLGAVVEAYDTRPVVKEQVESLGGKFVDIPVDSTDAQDKGGYAREVSQETLAKQQEVLSQRAMRSDAIITTAAVPGRPAPKLITEETVLGMAPGSVIVDLAAETGGNCVLTRPGETYTTDNGVTIIGTLNLPSTIPVHASQMYSKNIQNLLALLISSDGELVLDMADEIVRGTVITHDGKVLHEGTKTRMGIVDPDPEPIAETPVEPTADTSSGVSAGVAVAAAGAAAGMTAAETTTGVSAGVAATAESAAAEVTDAASSADADIESVVERLGAIVGDAVDAATDAVEQIVDADSSTSDSEASGSESRE